MINNYFELSALKDLYLEDSYVLKIEEGDGYVCFHMDLVLTESHEMYSIPVVGERYCYKMGRILFNYVDNASLTLKLNNRSNISSIESDLGNIDTFFCNDKKCSLEGGWGHMIGVFNNVSVEYD